MDPYLQFMMQQDPSQLPEERQRAVAQNLRGMAGTGALGSTSQIREISNAGTGAMDQSFSMGRELGLNKQRNLELALAAEEKEKDRQSLENRSAESNSNFRLTSNDKDRLFGLAEFNSVISGLEESFDDSFGNTMGLGLGERFLQSAMTSEGVLAPYAASKIQSLLQGKSLEEQAEIKQQLEREQSWWSTYERMSTIPERARAFGATLTDNELASWRAADINPGMSAQQIQTNLQKRNEIAKIWAKKVGDIYKEFGMRPEAVDLILSDQGAEYAEVIKRASEENLGGDDITSLFPNTLGGGEEQGSFSAAAIDVPAIIPTGVASALGGTQEEWDAMSDEEKLYVIEEVGSL